MIKWSEKYSIGIPVLDEQHKRLFEIAGAAYNLLKDTYVHDKYDKLVGIIGELAEYADYHFISEEAYMKGIGYKNLFTQENDHADFMKKVNSVNLYKLDANQDEYLKDILDFVINWVSEHILGSDKEIGEFATSMCS